MVKASKSDIDQVMSWKNRKKDSTGKTFDWTKQQRISNSIRVLKLEGKSEAQGIIGFTPNQS